MAGLVPGIHVFVQAKKDVDARHKAGHDEAKRAARLNCKERRLPR